MTTPEEVVERLRHTVTDSTWDELVPLINGNAFHLEHLRRYFMAQDYWELLRRNDGVVDKTIEQVAINYDCSLPTVRYNVFYKHKRNKE